MLEVRSGVSGPFDKQGDVTVRLVPLGGGIGSTLHLEGLVWSIETSGTEFDVPSGVYENLYKKCGVAYVGRLKSTGAEVLRTEIDSYNISGVCPVELDGSFGVWRGVLTGDRSQTGSLTYPEVYENVSAALLSSRRFHGSFMDGVGDAHYTSQRVVFVQFSDAGSEVLFQSAPVTFTVKKSRVLSFEMVGGSQVSINASKDFSSSYNAIPGSWTGWDELLGEISGEGYLSLPYCILSVSDMSFLEPIKREGEVVVDSEGNVTPGIWFGGMGDDGVFTVSLVFKPWPGYSGGSRSTTIVYATGEGEYEVRYSVTYTQGT